MDNIKKTQEYFNKSFSKLEKIKIKKQIDIIKATNESLKNKLYGKVLDIGSGGNFYYPINNINKIVCADISFSSLKRILKNEKIEPIVMDVRQLALYDNFFDCVIILHTLHHLAGNKLYETKNNLLDCLKETYRVLKTGGKIFIIDAFFNKKIEQLENIFYKSLFLTFKVFNKPMVYYFSYIQVKKILQIIGFKNISLNTLSTANAKLCPFDMSIGIPFKYTGLKHILIEAEK
ncbi:MAG: class I SAM-dependent methyltransferase [Candidatus Aenigmatarchaeota archaeon]